MAIFDAEVVDSEPVEINLRGVDGTVLRVETYQTVRVDHVEMLATFVDDPFEQGLYERLSTMASAGTPVDMVHGDDVRFDLGGRYRIFLGHFGASTDMDYYVRFAWDLENDRPADGESASGWNNDLDALRSAGLIEGGDGDALIEIAEAISTATPNARQRDIIVELLGESMLPHTIAPTPMSEAP